MCSEDMNRAARLPTSARSDERSTFPFGIHYAFTNSPIPELIASYASIVGPTARQNMVRGLNIQIVVMSKLQDGLGNQLCHLLYATISSVFQSDKSELYPD